VIRFRSTLASCGMTRQVRAQALLRLHPRATGDGHGDRAAVASPPAATSGPLCRRRGAPALAPGRCHLLVLTGGAEGPGARRADPPRRRPGEGRSVLGWEPARLPSAERLRLRCPQLARLSSGRRMVQHHGKLFRAQND